MSMEIQLFKIEYLFEMEDWMNFQLHYLHNSKSFKRTKVISLAFVPSLFALFTLLDIYKNKFNSVAFFIYILFSVVWVLIYKTRFEKAYKRRIQKLLNQTDNASVLGLQTLIFEEKHLILIQPKTENKINYDGIEKVEETENYLYLYNTSVSAVIIPKQKISSQELETLKKLIKEKIGRQKT